MRRAWWHQWFEGPAADNAEDLKVLLTRACRQEMALAFHLAARARAIAALEFERVGQSHRPDLIAL